MTTLVLNQSAMSTTFTYFPLLPTEIRLQIWRSSLYPRIVQVHIDPDCRIPDGERPMNAMTAVEAYHSRHIRPFYFRSPSPLPAALAVNCESREEALHSYIAVNDDSGPRFYLNPFRDTLYVEREDYPDDWLLLIRKIKSSSPATTVNAIAIHDNGTHITVDRPSFAGGIAECAVKEVFLVFEETYVHHIMPSVWPLWPPAEKNNGLDSRIYRESLAHRSIVRQLENHKFPTGAMPKVTAVLQGYWNKEGLNLSKSGNHQAVADNLIEKLHKLCGWR